MNYPDLGINDYIEFESKKSTKRIRAERVQKIKDTRFLIGYLTKSKSADYRLLLDTPKRFEELLSEVSDMLYNDVINTCSNDCFDYDDVNHDWYRDELTEIQQNHYDFLMDYYRGKDLTEHELKVEDFDLPKLKSHKPIVFKNLYSIRWAINRTDLEITDEELEEITTYLKYYKKLTL